MIKVYWPITVRVYLSILIVFILCVLFANGKHLNGIWIFAGVVLYFASKALLISFNPEWAYGPKGIEIFNDKGNVIKEYKWSDVAGIKKIYNGFKVYRYCPALYMKNDEQWPIKPFWTRNYRIVVKDLVGYIKENSKGVVDPWVENESDFWKHLFLNWDI